MRTPPFDLLRPECLRRGLGRLAAAMLLFAPAPALFAQCTVDDWSSRSGTVLATGQGRSYQAECGLTVRAGDSPAWVTTNTPNDESVIYARFYLYPNDLELSQGEAVVLRARDGATEQFRLAVRSSGDGLVLVPSWRSDGALVQAGRVVPLKNTWQAVTVAWNSSAVGGSLAIDIDGVRQLFIGDIQNDGEGVGEVDLGLVNNVAGSGSVAFDAFELRRAGNSTPLLTVNELFNISTRARVGNGAYAVVGGFVIEGEDEKCVVIRGRGQSINLDRTRVADPTLSLYRVGQSGVIGFNDDWSSDPGADLMVSLGRAPTHPRDAAMYTCLAPGGYTAQLRSVAGQQLGLGIVEVIDVDEGTPYLFNISTRAEVRAGAERVVAGFIIEGEASKQVLIRGRGPSVNLSQPRLANPLLELKSGPTVLVSNDDWQSAPNAGAIQGTGRAPGNARESAILTTLAPGAYTVFLQAADGGTGIGIVEVLDLSGGSIAPN
jgi:hypothetical protein